MRSRQPCRRAAPNNAKGAPALRRLRVHRQPRKKQCLRWFLRAGIMRSRRHRRCETCLSPPRPLAQPATTPVGCPKSQKNRAVYDLSLTGGLASRACWSWRCADLRFCERALPQGCTLVLRGRTQRGFFGFFAGKGVHGRGRRAGEVGNLGLRGGRTGETNSELFSPLSPAAGTRVLRGARRPARRQTPRTSASRRLNFPPDLRPCQKTTHTNYRRVKKQENHRCASRLRLNPAGGRGRPEAAAP